MESGCSGNPRASAFTVPYSTKTYPPPIEATNRIEPFYEEEFFRQGFKSFRIGISKIGED